MPLCDIVISPTIDIIHDRPYMWFLNNQSQSKPFETTICKERRVTMVNSKGDKGRTHPVADTELFIRGDR